MGHYSLNLNFRLLNHILLLLISSSYSIVLVHHHGIIGRVTAFHASSPDSIPARVRNFNSYLESGIGLTQAHEDN